MTSGETSMLPLGVAITPISAEGSDRRVLCPDRGAQRNRSRRGPRGLVFDEIVPVENPPHGKQGECAGQIIAGLGRKLASEPR
jgi:hypothetical protein